MVKSQSRLVQDADTVQQWTRVIAKSSVHSNMHRLHTLGMIEAMSDGEMVSVSQRLHRR